MTETELALASSRPGLHAQVYCLLQIGYFKAKHAFFRFDWSEVEDDCAFVTSRYFHGEAFERKPITKHEHYTQRERVAELFGYQLWAADFLPQLGQQATQTVRRDVTPGFVAAELIIWLNKHKIIRPGYTTLQELISETLSTERRRLGGLCWRKCWTTRQRPPWLNSWCVMTLCLNWRRSSRTPKTSVGVR